MKLINNNSLYLTGDEFSKYEDKLLGEGKDARVYIYSNDYLLKIYKECSSFISFEKFDTTNGVLKAYSPNTILEAINRQRFVKNTSLPKALVYVDGIFRGSLIKRHKSSIELHKIWGVLSRKKRVLILRRLLDNISELINNNIYHFDLTNCPDNSRSNNLSHSNILISRGFNVNIIDLDGRSTIYTTSNNDCYSALVYNGLLSLIIELICDIEVSDDIMAEDIRYYRRILSSYGLSENIILSLVEEEGTRETVSELIDLYEKKLILK